ncbi:hypothetical protein D3C75_1254220 [compost metagenome]
MAVVDGQHLGTEVFEQGLHQQQVGRIVIDAQNLGLALAALGVRLAQRATRLDQLQQQPAQLARTGRFGQ